MYEVNPQRVGHLISLIRHSLMIHGGDRVDEVAQQAWRAFYPMFVMTYGSRNTYNDEIGLLAITISGEG